MVDSLHTSAQLTQVMEVDVTAIARLRDRVKGDFQAREGVKLTYLPFFAKAAIDALKQHPKLNANLNTEAGEVTYFDREHVAFAVDTEKGLLTPVIKDAGDLSVAGLAELHYVRACVQESIRLWIVRRDAITELSDPDLLKPPFDRSFKRPGGYIIKHKLEAAKARAAEEADA